MERRQNRKSIMNNFNKKLVHFQTKIDHFLSNQFVQNTSYGILLESMRYSLLAGGKRIRPVLCMAFCEACGGDPDDAIPAGGAVEMVHTYSLIHDDLPCMDNDDYRRGCPTNHKVFGEAIATLAGDALLTAAFHCLAEIQAPADRLIRCIRILADAAGENGMVAGQILDLEGEKRVLSEKELRDVHRHKTGDMIRAACQIGAILAGGTKEQIEAAGKYAYALGMAFQIRDDMLDCTGTQDELGKPIGSDAENGKSTFVTLYGLEQCQALVEEETKRAVMALNSGQFVQTNFIEALSYALTSRTK